MYGFPPGTAHGAPTILSVLGRAPASRCENISLKFENADQPPQLLRSDAARHEKAVGRMHAKRAAKQFDFFG
jgi:hypothetical protein